MLSHFAPIKERVKQGEFMIAGGYQKLKEAVETVEDNYRKASEVQELGPRFSHVLQKFHEQEVISSKTSFDKLFLINFFR